MNKGKNIVIGVLIVLLLCVIGVCIYLIVDKANSVKCDEKYQTNTDKTSKELEKPVNKEEKKEEVKEEKTASTIFYENMVNNRKTIQEVSHGINIVMDGNGNVYYTSNHGETFDQPVGEHVQQKIDNFVGVANDGRLTDTLDGYKLDINNVIAIFHTESGNGGFNHYILLKADGTIGRLTYRPAYPGSSIVYIEDFKPSITGYNNIIGVINLSSTGGASYKLIDIKGNVYNIK